MIFLFDRRITFADDYTYKTKTVNQKLFSFTQLVAYRYINCQSPASC